MNGKALGRRAMEQLAGLVTPDTILRWYRELIAKKYDGTARRGCGDPVRPLRCNAWSSSSPPRTRARATPGSVARSATSVTSSDETPSSAIGR
jgi:hypothetical protein